MGFEKFASRNREKSVGGRERKEHMVVWSKISCQAAVIRLFFEQKGKNFIKNL